jgi:hypothetical protein
MAIPSWLSSQHYARLSTGLACGLTLHSIRQAVGAVRQAVLNGDVRQVLAQLSGEGVIRADSKYSYQLVPAFLPEHQSHLYTSAFDSPGSSRRCGGQYPVEHPAISDQEFLPTANDSVRTVRIAGDWARVAFTSPNPQHDLGE